MKTVTVDLGKDVQYFYLFPLSDLHVGDKYFRQTLYEQTLDKIAAIPNSFVVLNGDLMNNALKTSKSDSYEEVMPIERQLDYLAKTLSPIRDKILFMSDGNHEYRTKLIAGISPLKALARELGLVERGLYGESDAFVLNIMYGVRKNTPSQRNNLIIFGSHGSNVGGRRAGATANALEDMNKIMPNADLYLHAHTHVSMFFKDKVFLYDVRAKQLKEQIRCYYNSNSFVKYGGYAERAMFKPTDNIQCGLFVIPERYKETIRPRIDLFQV